MFSRAELPQQADQNHGQWPQHESLGGLFWMISPLFKCGFGIGHSKAPTDQTNIRIPQNLISGIPLH